MTSTSCSLSNGGPAAGVPRYEYGRGADDGVAPSSDANVTVDGPDARAIDAYFAIDGRAIGCLRWDRRTRTRDRMVMSLGRYMRSP